MKTFVSCTYFSFVLNDPKQILETCYSTIGYLHKSSHNFNTFFVGRTPLAPTAFKNNGLRIVLFRGKPLPKWIIPFKFHFFIQSLRPDYILVHGFGSAHYLVFLRLLLPKAKILLQCNGFAPAPKGFKKWVYQWADASIDGYLFTGIENAKPWYDANVFKKEKVFGLMEGGTSFSVTNVARTPHSFLWVAGLTGNKDPLTVVTAFAQFLETEPSAKLTMIYHEGDLEKAVKKCISKNEKLQTAVTLLGFVPHAALEAVYNQHRYFVSGSHFEGSGYALAEAMACGCVPIVTAIPSFQFMTDGCGFLFAPGDSADLFRKLLETQHCHWMIAHQKVLHQQKSKLTFGAIAAELAKIYESLP